MKEKATTNNGFCVDLLLIEAWKTVEANLSRKLNCSASIMEREVTTVVSTKYAVRRDKTSHKGRTFDSFTGFGGGNMMEEDSTVEAHKSFANP